MGNDNRGLYPNTLFVGQIPYQVTEEELKSTFPGCISAKFTEGYTGPYTE